MAGQTIGLPHPGRGVHYRQMVDPAAPPCLRERAKFLGRNYVADPPPAVLRAAKLHMERVEGQET